MPPDEKSYERHYEESAVIHADPTGLFSFIDVPSRLSAHMTQSSWMLGGGRMDVGVDEGLGQKVGSHIRLSGRVLGIRLFLDEAITRREPPVLKTWETVGTPRLLVIGPYRLGFEIQPRNNHSLLRVFIDYDLPARNVWLGRLFGNRYARWCVQQILRDASRHFSA